MYLSVDTLDALVIRLSPWHRRGTELLTTAADGQGSMLAPLFPCKVVTSELYPIDIDTEYDLYTEETALTTRMSPKRRKEFCAGRYCARRALLGLSAGSTAILRHGDGSPIWPPGVVGSITHTGDFCGTAVAWKSEVRSIGLDAEHIGHLEYDVWKRICTDDERLFIDSLPNDMRNAYRHLVFSAKESTYKCQYQLSRRWLCFHNVCISIDMLSSQFRIEFLIDIADVFRAGESLKGKFSIRNGYVLTGIVCE